MNPSADNITDAAHLSAGQPFAFLAPKAMGKHVYVDLLFCGLGMICGLSSWISFIYFLMIQLINHNSKDQLV